MARRTSDGLEALIEYNRLDLSMETLIIDEFKVYAPLFTASDRAAAQAKLHRQAGQVTDLTRDRERQLDEEDQGVIKTINARRIAKGSTALTPAQEAQVLENRRRNRTA